MFASQGERGFLHLRAHPLSLHPGRHQRLNASETVRKCEINGMKSSIEDKANRAEKNDRPDDEEPQLVPPDLDLGVDIEEGEEAKKEGTGLPPAMPPKV
jgi:hypothetical protein